MVSCIVALSIEAHKKNAMKNVFIALFATFESVLNRLSTEL